jgi:glutathione S-transferase
MSMMVAHLYAARESLQPLWRAQAFVWARLFAFNCDAAGLRWMIVALAVRSLGAAGALAERQLGRWARSVLRRACRAPVLPPSCALLTPRWQQRPARQKHLLHSDQERSMITLYGFGAGFGLPEISPFVTKTEVQLKMAGLPYHKQRAMPPASPKGQLPYIEDDSERIADSTFIRAHVERKYGFDFDAGLDLQQRAQAWAFERMIEHHVYWALVGARWVDAENFAKGPTHFFDGAPAHLREKLREDAQFRVAENYLLSGLGRHAPDDDVDLAVRSLFALSVQLGDKAYLMGDNPCGTDATAFGALAGVLTPFFVSGLRDRAEQFANLTAYVDRMMLQYYPDFAWTPLRQAA